MRHTTVVTAALVVLAMAIAPLGAAGSLPGEQAATNTSTPAVADNQTAAYNQTAANETNASAGEQLSAVAGVQEAELSGTLEKRSFGIQIANAASNDSKANVVKGTIGDLQTRLSELQAEKERLREARNNGSMSQGEYAARMAELTARTESVRQLATDTESVSSNLPEDVLRANGVNVDAIQTLQQDAASMTGPEVAAIARTIAGPQIGPVPGGQAEQPGNASDSTDSTDDEAGSASSDVERAESAVDRATETVERVDTRVTADNDDAVETLGEANAELDEAEATLEAAQTALENGNDAKARELAAQAIEQAESAEETARLALEDLSDDDSDVSTLVGDEDGESAGDDGSTTDA